MSDLYFNVEANSTNVRDKKTREIIISWPLRLMSFLAPGLTRQAALRLFFSPRRYQPSAEERTTLQQGRSFQFRVHDKILHGWRWGDGPKVLLFHGWNGSGIQLRRFIAPLVAAGFTAVAVDGPAHGASSGKVTSYFEFTDVLRKIVTDRDNFKTEGIIAHSFGAAAAINALVKEQTAIKTVCIAPVLRLQELIYHAFNQYGIPPWYYLRLIQDFEQQYGYQLEADNPHLLLEDFPGPLLIVHDVDDRTVPHRDSAGPAKRLRHVELWSSRGLGHSRVLQDRQVIHRCVEHIAG